MKQPLIDEGTYKASVKGHDVIWRLLAGKFGNDFIRWYNGGHAKRACNVCEKVKIDNKLQIFKRSMMEWRSEQQL